MNNTRYTDQERVTLDAHRLLNRAQEAYTAAANLRRFTKITRGELKDVDLTTTTIEAAEAAFTVLLEAAAHISAAKVNLKTSAHVTKLKEADNV